VLISDAAEGKSVA